MRSMRGMVITQARAEDPSLRGWTPHIPSEPELNVYLDMFNDHDVVARRATQMAPTTERSINVSAPLLFHFGPPPEGWDMGLQGGIEMRGLGACAPGDEFCDSGTQPKLATRMMTNAPRLTVAAQQPMLTARSAPVMQTAQQPMLTTRPPSSLSTATTAKPTAQAPQPSLTVTRPTAATEQPAAPPPERYYAPAPTQDPQDATMLPLPPAAASGSTSFPWWILAVMGAGYFAMQR